jgi:predicted NAD/FAD-binding protein
VRIAIVGTGVAGLVCAHRLHGSHDVTIFEAGDRVGGHANTVRVDFDDETHFVDTGFVVYNEPNYPNFTRLLREIGVASQPSDMSFSVSDHRDGLEFRTSNLDTLYAQRRNLVKPWFARMVADILRFNRAAKRLIVEGDGGAEISLEELVARGRYSRDFVERFLVPLGASIWSADPATFTRFPALAYARFMDNHGLLDLRGRPQWRTITGGSQCYVRALVAPFAHRIRTNHPVEKVFRHGDEVEVFSAATGSESFDRVILATHSDVSLDVLADPTRDERRILGAIHYQPNVVTLHTDERFLPRATRARASWNYQLPARIDAPRAATLTYWMNKLQSLSSRRQLLVTLNRDDEIDEATVLRRFDYAHPVFDAAAMRAQRERWRIQGTGGTFYAGAYWGYGFHEDAVTSAIDACRDLESIR